ncbi:MAG: RNA polymerase sigma factor [Solirubrobacteraceae bacterium]
MLADACQLRPAHARAVLGQRVGDVEEIGWKVVSFVVHHRLVRTSGPFSYCGLDDRAMREADFERLYAEHAQRLFGFLVYRTGDRALAEDLVGDTFEAAYGARARFDRRRASERTWLYAIALNLLRDEGRRRDAQARAYERALAGDEPLDAAGSSDRALERIAERDGIMRALGALSEPERECVALRFGADLSLKQIAAAIGEPITTVEGRLYRALRKLRDTLG